MPCFPSFSCRSLGGPDRSPWWLLPAAAGLALAVLAELPAAAQVSFGVNRVLTISAAGTPAQNCAGLRSTIAGITDADHSRRYVLQLEPGLYDCGSSTLFMKPDVYLEGAGMQATSIVGEVTDPFFGLIHLVNRSGLQDLSILNVSAEGFALAVSVDRIGSCPGDPSGCGDADLRNVSAEAIAPRSGGFEGIAVVVETISLRVQGSQLVSRDSALLNADGAVSIRNSILAGDVEAVGTRPVEISFSQFDGLATGSEVRCLYSYNSTPSPLSLTCM